MILSSARFWHRGHWNRADESAKCPVPKSCCNLHHTPCSHALDVLAELSRRCADKFLEGAAEGAPGP